MDRLALPDASCDLIVAHGIWNLARSAPEMRGAIADAARVARPRAGLFVFTFSRSTLPPDAVPVTGESFVFTQFSGAPQCFLTAGDLGGRLPQPRRRCSRWPGGRSVVCHRPIGCSLSSAARSSGCML